MRLDIVTLALPRLVTEIGIGSLLDTVSTRGLNVRWIFHLDVVPDAWSRNNLQENVRQAERVAARFSRAEVHVARRNRGYAGAVQFGFERFLAGDADWCLWAEDDWLWVRRFRLRRVIDAIAASGADYANLIHRHSRVGSTQPSLWSRPMAKALLRRGVGPEKRNKGWLRRNGWEAARHLGLGRGAVAIDIGRGTGAGGGWNLSESERVIKQASPKRHRSVKVKRLRGEPVAVAQARATLVNKLLGSSWKN